MVKVCHVTSVHNRYDVRIFHKECKSLAKNGYDVTLLVNDNLDDEVIDDIRIISIRKTYKGRIERIAKGVKDLLKKALEINAEVYHLHDPELLLIAKKLKKSGKKVIFDSHEHYYEQIKTKTYIPSFLRSIIAKLYWIYETNIFKKIDGVIYPGKLLDDNNNEVEEFTGRCSNAEQIANYPIFKEIDYSRAIKENQDIVVCYAGGLSENRGISILIDACYKAKCKLILAGDFESLEYETYLRNKESFACVDYRGKCSLEEVFKIYEESDIGAQLLLDVGQYYKILGFGIKVYEYMQMRLPVLTFDSYYNKKMIEKYNFGIAVSPSNIDDIVDAISKLRDSNLRIIMGENGYKLYRELFTWESQEKILIDLYKRILSKG